MVAVIDLATAWADAASGAGATAGPDAVAAVGADLQARWAQEHRRYHDTEHLREVLTAVDDLAGATGDVHAVRLAAWFHDAVYQARPGRDEQDSAALAQEVLAGLGVPAERVDAVARLVLMTVDHDPRPDDPDGAVLCDADLAVLGSPPERYERYVAAVRQEYASVPEPMFRSGRAAVLRALSAAPTLYRTAQARERWEAQARLNLGTELARLEG
jgi:predicted metal-dependent HD superfamily phosphohydrolase